MNDSRQETVLRAALQSAQAALASSSPTPRLDAEVLLAHVLKRDRSHLHAWPERMLSPEALADYRALTARRAAGEPIAYLTGRREFWSLSLQVTPVTLIPRPETELVVELALARIAPDAPLRVADLGTGCGAIALALAHERPLAHIVATDASAQALAVAQSNAARLGLRNVELRCGAWCDALGSDVFEMIVSNPPYVAADDPHLRQGDLRFEPRAALQAGLDGLDAIRHIADCAPYHLMPAGWLLLEHGQNQKSLVQDVLQENGFTDVQDHTDGAGLSRVTLGRMSAPD